MHCINCFLAAPGARIVAISPGRSNLKYRTSPEARTEVLVRVGIPATSGFGANQCATGCQAVQVACLD